MRNITDTYDCEGEEGVGGGDRGPYADQEQSAPIMIQARGQILIELIC